MFDMPLYMPLIAVVFSVFVSILSVRALGETDLAPVSGIGKVSQLLFALVAPGSAYLHNLLRLLLHSRILLACKASVPHTELLISMLLLSDVVANIIAGAISEAGYTATNPLLAVAQIDACRF